jgi:hypothetical protein
LEVKSPSEFIELSTAHARKQFEAMTAQTKVRGQIARFLHSHKDEEMPADSIFKPNMTKGKPDGA